MNKLKSLRISEKTHTELKLFCVKNHLKLNDYAEQIVIDFIKSKKEKNITN